MLSALVLRRSLTAAGLISGLFVATACSSSSSSSGPLPNEAGAASDAGQSDAKTVDAPAIEDFCAKTYGVVSNMLKLCCNEADRKLEEYSVTAEAAQKLVETCIDALTSGRETGHVTLDGAKAQECVDNMAPYHDVADTCWSGIRGANGGTACAEAFVGVQAEGDACARDIECKKGLWCEKASGKCTPPAENGDSCASSSTGAANVNQPRCVEGSYCTTDTKKCASLKKSGAACSAAIECASGHCYLAKCDDEGPVGAGEPCNPASKDCDYGLYCKVATGEALGTCTKKLAEGDECTIETECHALCKPDESGVSRCLSWCKSG